MRTATLLLLLAAAGAQEMVPEYCGRCGGPWTKGYGCTACYPRARRSDIVIEPSGGAGEAYVSPRDRKIVGDWNQLAGRLAALTGGAYRADPLRLRETIGPLDRAVEREYFAARADFDRAQATLAALTGERRALESALRRARSDLERAENDVAVHGLRRRKLDVLGRTLDAYRDGARARACARLEAFRRQGTIASPLAYLPPPPPLEPRYAAPPAAAPDSRDDLQPQPAGPRLRLYRRPGDLVSDERRAFRLAELERAKDWRQRARDARRAVVRKGLVGVVRDTALALNEASAKLARRLRESKRLQGQAEELMSRAHGKIADATGWGLVDKILSGRGDALQRTVKVLELTLDQSGDARGVAHRMVQAMGHGTEGELQDLHDDLWDGLYRYKAAVGMAVLGPGAPDTEAEWERRARDLAESSVEDVLRAGWKAMGDR